MWMSGLNLELWHVQLAILLGTVRLSSSKYFSGYTPFLALKQA